MAKKKENKPPAFQMYAADFYMDTQELTVCEVGAYTRLLMAQWVNGNLPNDTVRLANMAGMPHADFLISWPSFKKKFKETSTHRLYNERLLQTKENLIKFKATKSTAGKLGADVRWTEDMDAKTKLKALEALEQEKTGNPELVITGKEILTRIEKTYKEVDYIWKEEEFKTAWAAWIQYKKTEHKEKYKTPLSESRAILLLHKMVNGNLQYAIECIELSMGRQWRGIYADNELKQKYRVKPNNSNNKSNDTSDYHGQK